MTAALRSARTALQRVTESPNATPAKLLVDLMQPAERGRTVSKLDTGNNRTLLGAVTPGRVVTQNTMSEVARQDLVSGLVLICCIGALLVMLRMFR